jgi:excisionase family DNA binding protein
VTSPSRDVQARFDADAVAAEKRARTHAREAPLDLRVSVGVDALEAVAERAAELVLAQLGGLARSPYLTVPEAAEYLRCRRQRIDDLLSQGRLTRLKDGARTLVARAELEAYVRRLTSNGVAPSLPPGAGAV